MEQFTFIVSIVSLGLAVAIFIGNILSKGVSEAFRWSKKSSKVALTCFFIYLISFAGFFY